MGALFGGSSGGKGTSNQADWGQIERLMDLEMRANRFDDTGIFQGTSWQEGDDGKWQRTTAVNEALQPGIEAMMNRMSNPQDQYAMPDQMSQMLDAKMANQMGRQGLLEEGAEPQPQTGFGTPAAQQPGRGQQEWNPGPGQMAEQPPPQPQPQGQPGPQGPPQGVDPWEQLARMREQQGQV